MLKPKVHIKAVIIGHYGTGKSTLIGQLMLKLGEVDQINYRKIDSEFTFTLSTKKLQTANFCYTLIDTPGHKYYIKRTIRGISQADIAILIISAAQGEFEASIGNYGYTKELAFIAFSFGIKQIVVCVNKMDNKSCNWSKDRYHSIKLILFEYLQSIGFTSENIKFVPISGVYGDNLLEPSVNLSWYNGPTFIEILNQIIPQKRFENKPLRMPIIKIHNITGVGIVPIGCVQSGILKDGMTISLAPSGIKGKIKSIEMNNENIEVAFPGDFVGFNIDYCKIKKGMIVCDPECDPIQECASFIAEITIINHPHRIYIGYTPLVYCHTARVPCRFNNFLMKVDKKTGIASELMPSFLENGDMAIVELIPLNPMCVETFDENPNLGRIIVRDGKVIATGVIKEVRKK